MDIETALQRADEWAEGQTFNARSEGWRPAVAVLAGEVRRLRECLSASQALFTACQRDDGQLIAELQKDRARLDWLADVNNTIGNVQLPFECIEANLGSMRSAIDAAMHLDSEGEL